MCQRAQYRFRTLRAEKGPACRAHRFSFCQLESLPVPHLEIRCLDKVCHVHGAGPLGMAGPGFHEAGMMLTPGCASKLGSFSWPTWGSLCLKHMPCSLGVIATHESSHVFQEQDGHLQGARVQSSPYSANQKQVEAHSKYKGQVSNAPT